MADRRGYTSLYQNIPVQPLAGYSDPSAFIRIREAVRGLEDQVNQIRGTVGNSVPGYVSSVGLTAPTIFSVTGSPVTDTGTIALSLVSQTARSVFAAPTGTAGTPSFRALETADIQSGTFGVARGGTGLSSAPANGQLLIGNSTGYTLATLTAGTGITVTNGAGSIQIDNSLPGFLNPMTTLGDIIYGGAAGAPARLGGETTTTRKFLRSVGVAGLATIPAWDTVTKTDVGLSDVENTALSTWPGSSNLTTLGTVTTGTWNATSIAPANGGTGLTTAPAQDVIVYGGGSLSFSTLGPPSTGTKVLTWTSGIGITWTDKPVGTVTSVGLAAPAQFSVSNSPVTSSGTLTLAWVNQSPNTVLAGPSAGPSSAVPTFRSLVAADIPSLSSVYLPLAGGTMGGAINMGTYDINNVGQIGIGTASPSRMLHLSSTGSAEILLEADTDNVTETDLARILFKQDGGATNARAGFRDDNTFEIAQVEANDIVFRTTDTERVRITSGGNVGIGITNPGVDLEFVNTNAAFSTTTPGTTRYATHFRSGATNDQATGITWAGNNGTTTAAHAGIYVQSSGSYGTKMYFATTNSYATGAQTAMTIDHNRFVGIGVVPSYRFHVSESYTGAGQNVTTRLNSSVSPAATNANVQYGVFNTLIVNPNAIGAARALYSAVQHRGASNTGVLSGGWFGIDNDDAATMGSTISDAVAIYAMTPSQNAMGGMITNSYGLYVQAQSGMNITNSFGVYQAGTSDTNYFAGKVGIGVASPTSRLHLPVGTTAASTAPLKFTIGTNLTIPEAGAMEFDGILYFTPSTIRRAVAFTDSDITGTSANVTGTVGVANGGTGLTSFTAGQILYASATTTIAGLSVTSGGVLYGGATAPAYTAIADLNWDNTNKRLGISQSSPSYKLSVTDNNTALSTSNRVVSVSSTLSNAASNGNTQYGIYNFLSVGNNIAGTPHGIYSIVDKSGGANLATINAISGQATMNTMGVTVTNAAGLRAVSPAVTMGTFTNAYGLYIEQQDTTNVGTGYGIYQASSLDVNYYGGRVFLNTTDGTTDPNARLLVREDTNGATGMAVRNNDTGTNAVAFLALNTSTTGLVAYSFGSGYTTSGLFEGNGTALVSTKTNGLNIGATNAAGLLKFYTGGSASGNERMRIAANGNVTVDTNVLFVDAVNNRVGVNMTPTVALDVTGSAAVSGALTLTTTNLGYTTSGLQLRSSVPGASTSTDYFFHRGADTTVMNRIVVHTPSTSAGMGFAHMTSGGVTRFFSDGNTGNFTVDGGTLFVDAVNNEVGIGTTGPGQRLEVAGTLIVTGNSDMPASAGTNVRITGGYASPDIGRIFVGDGTGWKLHFSSRTGSANTDRVTFTDEGRVGIGATTPGVRLDVSETLAVATSSTFSAAAIRMNPVYTATGTITVKHRYIHFTQPTISGGTTTFTDAHTMYFDAAAGTHKAVDAGTTKTTPGTVNAWVKIDVNGTTYYVPAYTSKTA